MTSNSTNRTRKLADGERGNRAGLILLTCGHSTYAAPITSGVKKLYDCPEGCGLVKKSWRARDRAFPPRGLSQR